MQVLFESHFLRYDQFTMLGPNYQVLRYDKLYSTRSIHFKWRQIILTQIKSTLEKYWLNINCFFLNRRTRSSLQTSPSNLSKSINQHQQSQIFKCEPCWHQNWHSWKSQQRTSPIDTIRWCCKSRYCTFELIHNFCLGLGDSGKPSIVQMSVPLLRLISL